MNLVAFIPYIANRVQVIHEHTTPPQWHHLKNASNTADEGSRGMSPRDFMEKSEWIKGPDLINEPVESWLKDETYEECVDSDSPEVKVVKVITSAVKGNSDILKRPSQFSSWLKAKMAVALEIQEKTQG